jgi:gluconokinase
MGVAGSGKTTVGKALAETLGWEFHDADDFHSAENILKMSRGVPLDDDDRLPWLDALHALVYTCLLENRPGVLACSVLKETYRQALLADHPKVFLVYLKGDYALILRRMASRPGHYMRPEMLKSQFDALEEPVYGLTVDASLPVEEIVRRILERHL